jgi:hypothetical protein
VKPLFCFGTFGGGLGVFAILNQGLTGTRLGPRIIESDSHPPRLAALQPGDPRQIEPQAGQGRLGRPPAHFNAPAAHHDLGGGAVAFWFSRGGGS